jgi:hypothetical protein
VNTAACRGTTYSHVTLGVSVSLPNFPRDANIRTAYNKKTSIHGHDHGGVLIMRPVPTKVTLTVLLTHSTIDLFHKVGHPRRCPYADLTHTQSIS